MMGIGRVLTLKIAADKLRILNLSIEKGPWALSIQNFIPLMIISGYGRNQKPKVHNNTV
jgi:hypothetical protein